MNWTVRGVNNPRELETFHENQSSKVDESSLSMEILIWASSRWLKTVIRPIDSVIWGHYKPVSYQLKVDFRGWKFKFGDLVIITK